MTKFNLLSYLSNRERGRVKFKLQKSATLEYLEEKGSKPIINQPCELSGKCRATFLMDFSPDGTKVASTHGDHTVRVSDVATGKCLHILRGHPRTPWCIAFHPTSNQILASGCLGGEVRIWDLHGFGTEVWRSKDNYEITSLTFHPTDHVLVFSVTNHIYFWDWSQPEPFVVCKTNYEYEKIRWVKFDPLGQFLYTGIANNTTVRPPSRVSFISGNTHPNTVPNASRTQQLSNVYDSLVECFQASRRDRVLNQTEAGQGTHSLDRGQHLLETALRSSRPDRTGSHSHSVPRELDSSHAWQSLERHHLHPHYSVSILDNTINRPNDPIQTAINRAIADAFMGRGEPAVATNIINHTYRIQAWDFSRCNIPDLTDTKSNIVVQHCKLHNDASCNLSQDGTMLATFVPSHRGFPDDNIMAVYSLEPKTRGQCLFTKSFGPNAISVSLSPGSGYVMVGLAAKQLSWVFTPNQLVAQILKLDNKYAGEKSMQHITDVMHPCDMDIRTHVSVNSARWMPGSGEGIVYGTNRGDLHVCRPGTKKSVAGDNSDDRSIRRNLMHMLRMSGEQDVPRINTSTQTPGVRRSASTQTDTDDSM
uniref:Activating molecule in BECN1-regulated autophagy protein 1 n=1 Tax=Magallana gigas TaxID=29159 RepID=A0A8W8J4Z2_MAGGI